MLKRTIDFSTVRDIASTFPGVEESTSYGAPEDVLRDLLGMAYKFATRKKKGKKG
jgi:hypothetical protein